MKKTVLFLLIVLLAAALGFAGGQKEVEGEQPFRIAALFQTAIEEPWDGVIHQACLQSQKGLGREQPQRQSSLLLYRCGSSSGQSEISTSCRPLRAARG